MNETIKNITITKKGKALLKALTNLQNPYCYFIEDEYCTYDKIKTKSGLKILMENKRTKKKTVMYDHNE